MITKFSIYLFMDNSQESYQPNSDGIPIDLFISNKKPGNTITASNAANLRFTDSSANLVFLVNPPPRSHSDHQRLTSHLPFLKRILADSTENPLISIARVHKSTWKGFRKDSIEEKDLLFRVERNKLTKSLEFQVFINNGNPNMSDFKMRGSPFYRSCTIYKGDSIVAQTSLMYKLGIQNVVVPRNKFRLTIFPGYADQDFIVALIVIFFYGRKLWI